MHARTRVPRTTTETVIKTYTYTITAPLPEQSNIVQYIATQYAVWIFGQFLTSTTSHRITIVSGAPQTYDHEDNDNFGEWESSNPFIRQQHPVDEAK
jgi:hypothetical protein